jgi:hypothetical protein
MYYRFTTPLITPVSDIDGLVSQNAVNGYQLYDESEGKAMVQLIVLREQLLTGLAYVALEYELTHSVTEVIEAYLSQLGLHAGPLAIELMSLDNIARDLRRMETEENVTRSKKLKKLSLAEPDVFKQCVPSLRGNVETSDYIITERHATMKSLSMRRDVESELARIAIGGASPVLGHPVHYQLVSFSYEDSMSVAKSLVYHLHEKGRLMHNHMVYADFGDGYRRFPRDFDEENYSLRPILDTIAKGSALFLNFDESVISQLQRSQADDLFEQLSVEILQARHSTLFFIYTANPEGKYTQRFLEKLGSMSMVKIGENELTHEEAVSEMQRTLKTKNLDEVLAEQLLPTGQTTYKTSDIYLSFAAWYDLHLKSQIYPQYQAIKPFEKKVTEAIQGSAYQELQAMIGLDSIKATVDRFIASHHAAKVYEAQGLKVPKPSRHCVFLGDPGTAKTTVARLFGRILKENGLLTVGDFFEVSRADLVERYVGWTARNVKRFVRQAKGSVLFIDEAYALVDGHENSYGDEAIATLVEEMENSFEDVVIIFAGYKNPMEEFIKRNPGLRSRIGFTLDFPNYSDTELLAIADKMIRERGFRLSLDTKPRILTLIKEAMTQTDFGNGRYIRNLIDQAIMEHSLRLYREGLDNVTPEEVKTLTVGDFPNPDGILSVSTPKAPTTRMS